MTYGVIHHAIDSGISLDWPMSARSDSSKHTFSRSGNSGDEVPFAGLLENPITASKSFDF
jgi:hypothetical protein